ncbi:MAG: hypothetical protein ACYC5X_05680 [Syntrophales bacterium]
MQYVFFHPSLVTEQYAPVNVFLAVEEQANPVQLKFRRYGEMTMASIKLISEEEATGKVTE